jgi:hypothetical protein
VPGVAKEGLSIKLSAATPAGAPAALVIRGARPRAGGGEAVLRERRGGEFERRVPLPDDGGRGAARNPRCRAQRQAPWLLALPSLAASASCCWVVDF